MGKYVTCELTTNTTTNDAGMVVRIHVLFIPADMVND